MKVGPTDVLIALPVSALVPLTCAKLLAAGVEAPMPVAAGVAKGRKRPPRLTEAWFC